MSSHALPDQLILTINSGSSSIKFALYRACDPPELVKRGAIDRIGVLGTEMVVINAQTREVQRIPSPTQNHRGCAEWLLEWIDHNLGGNALCAVGHRVVHGGPTYSRPGRVDAAMMAELERLSPYDPEHLPAEIALIEAFASRHPTLPQVACFDTAFHRDMPRVARILAIPRRYERIGVQRYGFHGLSYAFLIKELARICSAEEANGRIIFAHLGNGASMAAVRNGRAIDTTMGFTPASGLVMSRRSGDLDPGLAWFLARTEGMNAERFHHMVNAESGLLGVSETSSDMRDLLDQEPVDPRAAEAIAVFCYQAKKAIGALAAAMAGLDMLVFTAGIGEHSPTLRARICEGLEFLGVAIDATRNAATESIISSTGSQVVVRVMHTDEEREIAYSVRSLIG